MTKTIILFFILFFSFESFSENIQKADTNLIRAELKELTKTNKSRNYRNLDQLNSTAIYIKNIFQKYADSVYFQDYKVDGRTYRNVVCAFGIKNKERIIVGAHYDVCGEQEGADDNASGVVGLLELARMLKGVPLTKRIELVAYTLEEPPYFRTENMGSYIHAKSLVDEQANVVGMISLEMIGFFSDAADSQEYPLKILRLFYGHRGNYITLAKKNGAGKFARRFTKIFQSKKQIRTKKFTAPAGLPGIDFSDHLNYWKFGFSALMITDTAFYRNRNYHQTTDIMETLNIPKMAKVIDGVYLSLLEFGKE